MGPESLTGGMPDLRLPAVAVLCGAGLLGFSIGGVATLRDEAPQVQTPHVSYVTDCDRPEREL